MDPQVASIAHRLAEQRAADVQDDKSDDDNLSDELDALEEELGITGYREQRLEELRQECGCRRPLPSRLFLIVRTE